jgi:hypothetical protein
VACGGAEGRARHAVPCQGDVAATLHHGEALVDELTATLDDVAYCHPPRPEIAAFYAGEYQARRPSSRPRWPPAGP